MATRIRAEPDPIVLRFGGGNHSRALEDEIDPRECTDGRNYRLDLEDSDFSPRNGYELVFTAANAGKVNGFVTHQRSDGSVTMLVQAGGNVYQWDGVTATLRGTVPANSKLRGRFEHAWELDDKVLITDLTLSQPVMEWDGTTLKTVATNIGNPFYAKYCFVSDERAFFANVFSLIAIPHMIVGSERSDYAVLSTGNRPSSALNEGDPFFLLTPDLKPVNGIIEAFQVITISSRNGQLFKLVGSSAKDFAFGKFFPRSAASGDEALVYVGNDAVYGRASRLESLSSTDKFGDVQSDDISIPIQDVLKAKEWQIVYNARVQRIYFFPDNTGECWVFHKDLGTSGVSPWVRWTTTHSLDFQPTAAMNCLDPADGLEYVFMGDSLGNVYRLEGSGYSDPSSTNVITSRKSALFQAPADAEYFEVEGWIRYRAEDEITLTLTFEWAGENVFDSTVSLTLPQVSGRPTYGGTTYYGGTDYYGTPFKKRLRRIKFPTTGQSSGFQVKTEVSAATSFEIAEIGLRVQASS